MNMVAGLFNSYEDVKWGIEVLENYGMDRSSISIVARTKNVSEFQEPASGVTEISNDFVELFARLSAIAFTAPELGPVLATGHVAFTWFNKLGPTFAGGLLGVLLYAGFAVKEAEFYEEGVKRGSILMLVDIGSQVEHRIRAILLGAGAVDMDINIHYQSAAMFDNVEMSQG